MKADRLLLALGLTLFALPARALDCPPDGGALAAFPGDQDQIAVAFNDFPLTPSSAVLTWTFTAWRDARDQATSGLDIRDGIFGACAGNDLLGGEVVCDAALDQSHPAVAISGYPDIHPFTGHSTLGLIVAFEHDPGGDADIYARRTRWGESFGPWDTAAIPICAATGAQSDPVVVGNQYGGGAIIGWVDRRSGGADIYAQRVDSTGAIQWAADGIPVCAASGDQTGLEAVSDGFGGAYFVWHDARAGNALYAIRFTPSGDPGPGWSADGDPVVSSPGVPAGFRIADDLVGGLIVGWTDLRDDADGDVYVQRMTPVGGASWNANGKPVATGSGTQTLSDVAAAAAAGAYVVWKDEPPSALEGAAATTLRAQRLDGAGDPTGGWPAAGQVVSDAASPKDHARAAGALASLIDNGLIVIWSDLRNADADLYAFRLLPSGADATGWTTGGTLVCGVADDQLAPEIVRTYEGGANVVWLDWRDRATNGADVYGAHLTSRGLVDAPPAVPPARLSLGAPRPNPARGAVSFRLELPSASRVSARVVDVSGRTVRTLAGGTFPAGARDLAWDGRDDSGRTVATGVYFVSVRAGTEVTRRVVMLH